MTMTSLKRLNRTLRLEALSGRGPEEVLEMLTCMISDSSWLKLIEVKAGQRRVAGKSPSTLLSWGERVECTVIPIGSDVELLVTVTAQQRGIGWMKRLNAAMTMRRFIHEVRALDQLGRVSYMWSSACPILAR